MSIAYIIFLNPKGSVCTVELLSNFFFFLKPLGHPKEAALASGLVRGSGWEDLSKILTNANCMK